MTVIILTCAVFVVGAAVCALVRLERGPSMLDRTVALDVLTSALVAVLVLEAAWSRRVDSIPIIVAIALVGFIGSVTIARFAAVEPVEEGRLQTAAEAAAEEEAERVRVLAAAQAERRALRAEAEQAATLSAEERERAPAPSEDAGADPAAPSQTRAAPGEPEAADPAVPPEERGGERP